jgi:hypothetical protein
MPDYEGLLQGISRVTDTPAEDRAATRAVLARVADGRLTHAQARSVLQALGLAPYEDGGRYRPTGQRDGRRTQRSQTPAGAASRPSPSSRPENAPTAPAGARNRHQERQ